MSNKTSDKNVVTEEDLEVLNEVLLHNRETEQARIAIEHMLAELEQILKERDVANDSVIAHKFAVMQQQLEQKDKRIQELEEENEVWDRKFCKLQDTYFKLSDNSIPKQVVIDLIEYLKRQRRELGFKTYLKKEDIINDDRVIMCEISVLQELLQESEDK